MRDMVQQNCASLMCGKEYAAEEVAEAARSGRLLSMELELSRACNLHCIYCYAEAGLSAPDELTLEEILDAVKQGHELGARKIVVLGGGEPLLYPNLNAVLGRLEADVYLGDQRGQGGLVGEVHTALDGQQGHRAVERAGVDMLHLDIMDGHFVPNLTYGPKLVKSVRGITDLPLDVHLMIDNPQVFIERFATAGADNITVHSEVTTPIPQLFEIVKSFDISFGVSIKPDTKLDTIADYLDMIDILLVMTVHPGFGGQEFIESTIPTIAEAS